ncbi:MAG: AzlD domain-containing protein [Bacteriovoracaceae bacterium]
MIDNQYFLLNVVGLAIGTILIRGFFILFSGKMNISTKIKELFTFIPAAIFPALIMPGNFFHKGSVSLFGGKERFVVLIVSGIVCYFVRNTLFIICFGLILLYTLVKFL